MTRDPILAMKNLPKGTNGYHVPMTLKVVGGLHYLRGNRQPYFSLTCDMHRKGFANQCQSGGCDHELILKHYPRFADLAALHLSDMDGVPSHAAGNGWYNLAGALPDFAGETYHTGNSKRHFPKAEIDLANPWDTTDYRLPTPDECLQVFADYVRISVDEAKVVAENVRDASYQLLPIPSYDWTAGRKWFAEWIGAQRPRWKAEAEACITKHDLLIYGDQWPNVA